MTDDLFWALSPEYAQKFFASKSDPVKPFCEIPGEPPLASQISRKVGRAAVIKVDGALEKTTWVGFYSGRILSLGYDVIQQAIGDAIADSSISTILLSLDSPGGTVSGAKELADYIADAAKIKPIAAYADGLCASAAFWLAAATGRIFAPATALVGSVGVIMRCENWSAWYNKAGIQIDYIASGRFKAAGQEEKELTDEERKYFEDQLAAIHAIFKTDVKAGLALAAEEALWAEAQLLPATRAVELGLVSRIVRDEAEAIAILSEKAEEFMPEWTLEALQKNAPELLAEIEAKAKADVPAPDNSLALAVVKIACGEEAAASCEKLLAEATALGMTAAQLEAVKKFIPVQAAGQASASRLEAIISAHEKPLNPEPAPQAKSSLLADAERRAMKRSNQ